MSLAPPNIVAFRQYFVAKTGIKGNIGIVSECGKRRDDGYHLGIDEITSACGRGIYDPESNRDGDYSTIRAVDRRWLSKYASAVDIGSKLPLGRQKALTAFLERQAKAGKLPGVVEFLGPGPDSRAYWWGRSNGWKPVRLAKGNSHEWHVHISFNRKLTHPESGFPDLIHLLEPFFGPRPGTLPPDDDEPPPPPDEPDDNDELRTRVAELEAELERVTALAQEAMNALGWRDERDQPLVVDGIPGALTTAALEGIAAHVAAQVEALHRANREVLGALHNGATDLVRQITEAKERV